MDIMNFMRSNKCTDKPKFFPQFSNFPGRPAGKLK